NAEFPSSSDVRTLELALVGQTKYPQIKASAIRRLSAQNTKELATEIHKLTKDQAPEVRAAAIEAIPFVCPTDRWATLEESAKIESNNIVLRRLMDTLSLLKSQGADSVLRTVEARLAKLTEDLRQKATETRKDLHSPPNTNRCGDK